jgi:hypothetical protein
MTANTMIGIIIASALAPLASAQLIATGSPSGGQNRYYNINPSTGVATPLSSLPVPIQPTTTAGLAFSPAGTLYGIAGGQLVLPNTAANTYTVIGGLGDNPPGIPINAAGLEILTDGRAFTYQTNEFSPLYQIDLSTGTVTGVGGTFDLLNAIVAAGGNLSTFVQPIVTCMGSVGGTLYAVENRTNTFIAIDPNTAAVTVPTGMAGQLTRGTLANGNLRSRYSTFAAMTGYDADNDGDYDRLFGTVNTFDGNRLGALIEFNLADGSWELIGTGNNPLNFFAMGAPVAQVSGCDSIDFNNDGLFPDTGDIDDFLSVFSGGPCSNDPNCNDVDYNNDGLFPDTLDIDAFLSVFSGGPCL